MKLWHSIVISLGLHAAVMGIPLKMAPKAPPQEIVLCIVDAGGAAVRPDIKGTPEALSIETDRISKHANRQKLQRPPVKTNAEKDQKPAPLTAPPIPISEEKEEVEPETAPAETADALQPVDEPARQPPESPSFEADSDAQSRAQPGPTSALDSGDSFSGEAIFDASENGVAQSEGNAGGRDGAPIRANFGTAEGPQFARKALPEYPPQAKHLKKEGRVVLELTIDEKGILTDVEVVQAVGFGFHEAAIKAIRESSFRPAQKNGRGIACKALLPVRFELR